MAQRLAVVGTDGKIENVIVADSNFSLEGFILVPDEKGEAQIGGMWVDGKFFPRPQENPAVPVFGEKVDSFKVRMALHREGLLEAVEAAMEDPDVPKEIKLMYEYAPVWKTDDPLFDYLAAKLRKPRSEIDAIVRNAV